MQIDHAFFHEVCIDILYGLLVVLLFVLIERLIYYGFLALRARRIQAVLHHNGQPGAPPKLGRDPLSLAFSEYLAAQRQLGVSRDRIEDLSSALFMRVDQRVSARLWILDTIVTAAPLLGLLGTILGIMDTFNALSSGGVSDPAAVSRGIGEALIATAIGIFTALCGLLAHNLLHRQADVITDGFKSALLAATGIETPAAAE